MLRDPGPVRSGCEFFRSGYRSNQNDEVSEMRKFLAMAVLGSVLAFGAGTALASDTVDHGIGDTGTPIVSSQTDDDQSVVAGGDNTPHGVYQQLRDENFGH